MSSGSTKRSRSERVSRTLAPRDSLGRWQRLLTNPGVLGRLGLCLLAALAMWGVTGAWTPHFSFRTGYIPPRAITTRTNFSVRDDAETEARRRQARSEALCVYQHDGRLLAEL